MKRHLLAACAAAITLSLAGPPTHAQWIVFDPTNYVENFLTALRSLEQINNQIRSLQNEAVMLQNEARNLTSLPSSVLGQLRSTLETTKQLLAQARGMTFDIQRTQADFAKLYPEVYDRAMSSTAMAADARQRWTNSLEALRTATAMQAQATRNLLDDEGVLADLVDRSQGAEGALQTAQATNQLLALQVRQAMQDQHLRIAQERAAALEQARAVAGEERSREVRRRFIGGATPYTPFPIGGF